MSTESLIEVAIGGLKKYHNIADMRFIQAGGQSAADAIC